MNRQNNTSYGKSGGNMRRIENIQSNIERRGSEKRILRRELDCCEINAQEMSYKRKILRFQTFCRQWLEVSTVSIIFVGLRNVLNSFEDKLPNIRRVN